MSHTFAACRNCHSVNRIKIDQAQQALCGKCQAPIKFQGLVSEASKEEFLKILRSSDRPVIVDFWASWCGPCKMYGPEFEMASLQSSEAVFLKINTESEQQLASDLGIRGIPCTIVFKDGKESLRQAGAMDAKGVLALLKSV
jgi:thioredoxin 2